MKTKKRKKSSRRRTTMGRGARKKAKKSGHRGGKGMAGTGKRADQKKTLMTKLYGNDYFGKQGVTSRGTKRRKEDVISLKSIILNLDNYVKNGIAKKSGNGYEIHLDELKILWDSHAGGVGEVKIGKLTIYARSASKQAEEIVKKAGGEIILKKRLAQEKPINAE